MTISSHAPRGVDFSFSFLHKIPVYTPSDTECPLRVCYPALHAQGKAMYVIIVRDSQITSICLTAANLISSSVAPAYTTRRDRFDELVRVASGKEEAFSTFINDMWRNSHNDDFWKSPEKSGQSFDTLDETIDTEMGGVGVLPTQVRNPLINLMSSSVHFSLCRVIVWQKATSCLSLAVYDQGRPNMLIILMSSSVHFSLCCVIV